MKKLQEIKDEIIAAKEAKAELAVLNSSSKVSIWRLLIDTIATVIWIVYQFFDQYKVELQSLADKGYFGSSAWFVNEIRKFQYGYDLQLIGNKFQYTEENEEAKIVHQVALEALGQLVNIKVAKLVNNELTSFEPAELNALRIYINQIKFPGTFINVVSQPADLLNLHYRVYYNAMHGEATTRTAIETALKNYLNDIVFNGKFDVAQSVDALQAIAGVKSPYLVSADARAYNVAIADAVSFTENYYSVAGYMKIENLTFDLIAE